MVIRAWEREDRSDYIVQVGADMYYMNARAHLPNGVCQHVGASADLAWTVRDRPIAVERLPYGTRAQIDRIAERLGAV